MSSIGTGYDLSTSTYSPDGKLFQLDYAQKCVDSSGTTIAINCIDGVVLATESLIHSKLLVKSNKRLASADVHVAVGSSGLVADARQLVNRTRQEAAQYRKTYKQDIPALVLVEKVSQFIHAYTLYSSVRPFGVSIILALYQDKPNLYMIDPTGLYYAYNACAIGKGKQVAKNELEKINFKTMTCRQAVIEAARMYFLFNLVSILYTMKQKTRNLSWK